MNSEKFYIDCDEVLRQTLDTMIDLYNENFASKKTRDDIKSFVVEDSFPEIQEQTGTTASHWFFQEHSKEIFVDVEPFPYVAEDIKKLREYGEVIIVTYQKTTTNKIQTLLWLDKHGIEYDGICFIKNKENVVTEKGSIFIDDNDWNFSSMNAKCGVLINAPYNEDIDIENLKNDCGEMIRCKNLHDFTNKYVKANKILKDIENKYLGKVFELKDSIPFTEQGLFYKRDSTFGCEGTKVRLTDCKLKGITPYIILRPIYGFSCVFVDYTVIEKYLVETND